jgi:hypothetical protein
LEVLEMNKNEKTCVYCGQVLDEGNVYEFHDKVMCEGCFNEHTAVCECCNDSVYYESDDSDIPYCESCFDRINNAIIKTYNFKPKPIFYGSDSMFMGVELEIDKGGECIENAETLL